jgi:hypothetical protein
MSFFNCDASNLFSFCPIFFAFALVFCFPFPRPQDPKTENNPYMGFIYTSFQERATKISHGNTARMATEVRRVAAHCRGPFPSFGCASS